VAINIPLMFTMGTKTDQHCSQCPQKDGCKEVYVKLGRSDVPNVAGAVCWAFLAPIGLFAVLAIGLEPWLPAFDDEKIRTATIYVVSVVVTVMAVWTVKQIKTKK